MDLRFTPAQDEFRSAARDWLTRNVPREPLASMDTADGFEQHRAWERILHDGGWGVVSWPPEYGGRAAGLVEWLIFEHEYHAAGAPGRVNQNGLFLLGPTLMEFGTAEQKARFLPRLARGEDIWSQGWSEPDAGSDLASLGSRAELHGDEWVLNGQKTWCSRGVFADWMFGLFRSDPSSEKHRGLTYILVPLRSEGVTVRSIRQMDGRSGFAEVFLDDVRVPVDNTVGEPGEGWKIAMATAGFERGLLLRPPGRFLATAQKLADVYKRSGAPAELRDAVASACINAKLYELYSYWTVSRVLRGGTIGAEASLNKIFWSEMDLRMHETAMRLEGLNADGWSEGYLFSLAGPIYAGTNEIQRNVLGERVLGLPREP